jgi:hypothetical protein
MTVEDAIETTAEIMRAAVGSNPHEGGEAATSYVDTFARTALALSGYSSPDACKAVVGCRDTSVDFDTERLRRELEKMRARLKVIETERDEAHERRIAAQRKCDRIEIDFCDVVKERDNARQLAENHKQAREVAEGKLMQEPCASCEARP